MRQLLSMLTFAIVTVAGAVAQNGGVRSLVLRPGDVVRLEVPDMADLGGEFAVSEDGTVLLPLIGSVVVAGRPFAEVTRDIAKSYSVQLLDTPVRVTPVLRIAVLGEVRQPGLIPADPTYTIADVVAAAGGLAPDGDPGKIALYRAGESIDLSLDDGTALLAGSLMPGDQIVVGRRSWLSRNLNVLVGATATVVAAAVTSLILR